jgi:sporulation protein YlmC with PRC-barrel domain
VLHDLFIRTDELLEINMIRTLLTTTALAALLAGGAIAQDAPAQTETPATEAPATDTESTTDTEVVEDVEVITEGSEGSQQSGNLLAQGYTIADTDNLASRIMGAGVYSSEADDAEHIGDINDLVVNDNGEVAAVIIGVGGFLGMGEKLVAVDYSELQWVIAADNTERFVLPTTREDLEAAPAFETRDDDPMAAGGGDTTAPGAGTMGADPATDPAADPAAQPGAQPADGAMAPDADMGVDRSAMQEVDPANLTADDLTGTDVYGPNDEHIGTIGDLVLGENDSIDAIIIDFGGFLGIGVKQVAVAYENLRFLRDEGDNLILMLNLTREQMEQAPEFNRDTYAQEREGQRVIVQ